MEKGKKVLWTENAVQDLLAIKEFIAQDSIEHAEKWILDLITAGDRLLALSKRGRVVPEFNQVNLRELLLDNYRLVYRVKPAAIEIITIFEGHRLLKPENIQE